MSHNAEPRIYLVAAVAANGIIGANGQLPWHLPGRGDIVVTGRPGYEAPGAAVATSLEAALALCIGEPVVFVIGGTRLFETALPVANGLRMTEIHRDYQGDTGFPRSARWRGR